MESDFTQKNQFIAACYETVFESTPTRWACLLKTKNKHYVLGLFPVFSFSITSIKYQVTLFIIFHQHSESPTRVHRASRLQPCSTLSWYEKSRLRNMVGSRASNVTVNYFFWAEKFWKSTLKILETDLQVALGCFEYRGTPISTLVFVWQRNHTTKKMTSDHNWK